MDINTVTITGRLTRDPEQRFLNNGTGVCSFGMASNHKYRDKSGEQKSDVVFIDVEVWGKSGEWVAANLTKGNPVFVSGRLKLDQWTTDGGEKRSRMKISAMTVLSLAKSGTAGSPTDDDDTDVQPAARPRTKKADQPKEGDDDIPF